MNKIVIICVLIIIYSFNLCQCQYDDDWNIFQNENREELVVRNVVADRSFPLKSNVKNWKSISVGPICYSVGLSVHGIHTLVTVLNSTKTGFEIKSSFYATENKPSDVVIFRHRHNGTFEAILVVSYFNQSILDWFKISPKNTLQQFWSWSLESPAEHINIFKIQTRNLLLFTTTNNAFMYEFDIKNNPLKKWFVQLLPLEYTPRSSAFNNFNNEYFLSIPQKDSVLIYKYLNNQFKKFTKLDTPHVTSLVNFDFGFKTFLAVNGLSAGIYEFSSDGLTKKEVLNSNLQGIHFWLPILIDIYRVEVILLSQRSLDYSTHQAFEVDIFTYNNGKFEEHDDVPCSLHEEISNSLGCLTYENGISGSSYVIIEDKIGLIVPRLNKSFTLFMIHTDIKQNPNPAEKKIFNLVETKKRLEILIEQQNYDIEEINKLINQIPKNRQKNIIGESQILTSYLEEVKKIGLEVDELFDKVEKITNHEKQSKFDTIFINGNGKFQNLKTIEIDVEYINQEHCTTLLNDIVSKGNITKQLSNKTFIELSVDNLTTNIANGINTDNIVFNDTSDIIINGNITFNNFAKLENIFTKKINDVNFEEEIVHLDKNHEGTLDFEQIKVEENLLTSRINDMNLHHVKSSKVKRTSSKDLDDTIFIPKNLTVTYVNGENLTEFLHSLCMINRVCYIPGTIHITNKIHTKEIQTDFLNDLKFPEEFILLNSETSTQVTGKKTFKNSLTAEDIRSTETINGVDMLNLVTLSTDQNLQYLTFKNLELTEQLDVDGNIFGESIDKFLPNPTLEEIKVIKSNVNFKNLEAKNIVIANEFNDKNFKEMLKNLLYRDEPEAVITSLKDFSKSLTATQEFEIKSNSINTASLDKFVTKNTEQSLNINLINGNVGIKNLVINGSYDGKNIKDIDESLVKLSGDQFISSALSFNDLVVENFEINDKLNGIKAEQYLYNIDEEIIINKNVGFDNLIVENLDIKGNLDGVISGFDINDISKKYLSLTKNQTIEPVFNLNSSKIDNLILSEKSNKEELQEMAYLELIKELLNTGQIKVENLRVEDSINVANINDKPTSTISPLTVLEIAGKHKNELILENDLYLKEIDLINLCGVNWNDYVKQIVFKNQTNTKISFMKGKTFLNGIKVENLIETKKLNNISLENILKKVGDQIVRGHIEIVGDLLVENIDIKETMNDIYVEKFLKFILVTGEREYYIKSDIMFKRLSYIQSLKINGSVNNKNIEEILSELVYQNKKIILNNDIIFIKPVQISRNLAITDHFNSHNFSDIISKIVLITKDTEIDSLVSFYKDVDVQEKFTIEEDLSTKFVAGFNTKIWQEKAVYTNKGLIDGHYMIDSMEINQKLITSFINNVNMTEIISLKSNQTIDYLHFGVLKCIKHIPVGNKVNGLTLTEEVQRTLMNNADQDISSTIIFKNILIRQHLNTIQLNGKPTSKIVRTNTKQTLTAKYNFNSKINLESDLNVKGLINKVDYENWKNSTLKLNSNNTQIISNVWKVLQNLTFQDNVYSCEKINDLDLVKIAKEIQKRKDFRYQFEHGIIKDYLGICESLTYLYQKAKSQIYKFKYFEDFQMLSFKDTINYVMHFNFNKSQYLLINKETCLSDLMIYNDVAFVPFITNIPTGLIQQVVVVTRKDAVFLVILGKKFSNCKITAGTNVWKFKGKHLELKFTMEQQDLLQESQVPSTFYSFGKEGVIEYRIRNEGPVKVRKWKVYEDNMTFVPRGLKTGLAMRTGEKLIYLDRTDPIAEDFNLGVNMEAVLKGSFREVHNRFITGTDEGDMVVSNVGINSAKKHLLAIAEREETFIKGSLDAIKIYENPLTGELFGKVLAYKPSNLLSIEFNQGETLLAFLEDKRNLKVYEYKGIEGFQHRNTIKVRGASSLFQMDFTENVKHSLIKIIGIVYKNKIKLLEAVMDGTKIRDDLYCRL